MTRKTEGVYELVEATLEAMGKAPGEDVTEDVFCTIEGNPELLRQYRDLEDELTHVVVNNWIGMYTKEQVAMETVRKVAAMRTTLATSYTKLRH